VGAMSERPLHVVRGREAETPPEAPARPDFDGFFADESERLFRRSTSRCPVHRSRSTSTATA
jgi:hypothetical protein